MEQIQFEIIFNKNIDWVPKNREYTIFNLNQLKSTDIFELLENVNINFDDEILVLISLKYEGIINILSVESTGLISEGNSIDLNISITTENEYTNMYSKNCTVCALKIKKTYRFINFSYLSGVIGSQNVAQFQSGHNDGGLLFGILRSEDELKNTKINLENSIDWSKKQLILFQFENDGSYEQRMLMKNVDLDWKNYYWSLDIEIIVSEKVKLKKEDNKEKFENYFLYEMPKTEIEEINLNIKKTDIFEGEILFEKKIEFEIKFDEEKSKNYGLIDNVTCESLNSLFLIFDFLEIDLFDSVNKIDFSKQHLFITKNKELKKIYSEYTKGNSICNYAFELVDTSTEDGKININIYSFDYIETYIYYFIM